MDIRTIKRAFHHKISSGILISLSIFGSLNLKELIELLGQSKTSTLRYLKELVISGDIVIDQDMTAKKWGKYYTLSPSLSQAFNSYEDFLSLISRSEDSILTFPSERLPSETAYVAKNLAEINSNFNLLLENHLKTSDPDSDLSKSVRNLLLNSLTDIALYSKEDEIEFIRIVKSFMVDLHQFAKAQKAKRTESKEEKSDSTIQTVYISTIPLGKVRESLQNRK